MKNIDLVSQTLENISLLTDKANIQLLALAVQIENIRKEELAKLPLHINVIKISAAGKLRETAHSSILQQLLKFPSILDSFIKSIICLNNIKITPADIRNVEQDNMDISIFAKNACIIIENKINNAPEQQGQIYRYVDCALKYGYDESQIHILYLNSNHRRKPSVKSLTANGENLLRIPKTIEDNMLVMDYAHDIYSWIKDLHSHIPICQPYLLSALHQYQDYLEEHFHLTDKFKDMKESIKVAISTNILNGLSDDNDADFSARINRLEETSENLQQLIEGVNELIAVLSAKRKAVEIQSELAKYDLTIIDLTKYGYDQYNYGVRISINGKSGYIAYGEGDGEYIGFAFDTELLTKSEKDCLCKIFKKFGKVNFGEEDSWPCWNYIGETSLLNEFTNFVLFVREQSTNIDKYHIDFK